MNVEKIREKAGPLQNYAWFLALAFLWYLADNLFTSIEPVSSESTLGTVLRLGYITVIFQLLVAGLIGGVYDKQKDSEASSFWGFIAGIKKHYWRIVIANVISMAAFYAIVIVILIAGGDKLSKDASNKLLEFINIPFSAISLFWYVAIIVERKIFKGLIEAIKTLSANPLALIIGIVWAVVRFADSALVDSLNGQVFYAIDAARALVVAAARVAVTVYALAAYKQGRRETPEPSGEADAADSSSATVPGDGLVNGSFALAFVSFIPLLHIASLTLGIISLKQKKRFVFRSAIACCVGGFFTIFYLLVIAGWLAARSFPANTPGYAFLTDANPALKPQIELLEKGSYDEVQKQLEGKSNDWSANCLLALAKYQHDDLEGALEDFSSAAKQKPDRGEFYYYYGLALFDNHAPSAAAEKFKTALTYEPKLEAAERYLNLIDHTYNPSILFSALMSVVILTILFALHEYGHAYAAWKLGDDTAKNQGRLTLNPAVHLDPFGSIILPALLLWQQAGVVFGWAKPVPIDPRNFQNPRRDQMRVSFAGPAVNFLISMACLILMGGIMISIRLLWPETLSINLSDPYAPISIVGPPFAQALLFIMMFLKQMFYTSIVLGCFNLLPIPPLDGSWILSGLLPPSASDLFEKIRRFSFILFIVLVATPVVDYFLMVPMGFAWGSLAILFSAMGLG
jgi:Zn-dependent protease